MKQFFVLLLCIPLTVDPAFASALNGLVRWSPAVPTSRGADFQRQALSASLRTFFHPRNSLKPNIVEMLPSTVTQPKLIIPLLPPILRWWRVRFYGESRLVAKLWVDDHLEEMEENIFHREVYQRVPAFLTRSLRILVLAGCSLSGTALTSAFILATAFVVFYGLKRYRSVVANITQAFLFATAHVGRDWLSGWTPRFTMALGLQALWNEGQSQMAIEWHRINNQIYDYYQAPDSSKSNPWIQRNRLAWGTRPILDFLEPFLGQVRLGPESDELPNMPTQQDLYRVSREIIRGRKAGKSALGILIDWESSQTTKHPMEWFEHLFETAADRYNYSAERLRNRLKAEGRIVPRKALQDVDKIRKIDETIAKHLLVANELESFLRGFRPSRILDALLDGRIAIPKDVTFDLPEHYLEKVKLILRPRFIFSLISDVAIFYYLRRPFYLLVELFTPAGIEQEGIPSAIKLKINGHHWRLKGVVQPRRSDRYTRWLVFEEDERAPKPGDSKQTRRRGAVIQFQPSNRSTESAA